MSIFQGRYNSMGRQTFKSGVLKMRGVTRAVKETKKELVRDGADKPLVDKDGKPTYKDVEIEVEKTLEYVLKPSDIGKSFDFGADEEYLKAKYPQNFLKVEKPAE